MRCIVRRLHLHRVAPAYRASRDLARTPRQLVAIWLLVARGFAERYIPALRSNRLQTITVSGPTGDYLLNLRRNAWDTFTFYEVFLKRIYRAGLPLPQGAMVVDCGANIGLASVYFALHTPDIRITAVEPEPSNFSLLERNLSGVRVKVNLHHAVLTDRPGEVILGISTSTRHHIDRRATSEAPGILVRGLTLDDVLANGDADLIKVDIEGEEQIVFARTWRGLERARKLLIEIHCEAAVEPITRQLVASGFDHLPGPAGETQIDAPEVYVHRT